MQHDKLLSIYRSRGLTIRHGCVRGLAVALALIVLVGLSAAHADSAASKNKEGNRLFQQGRYQDAEKAYLNAEVQSPGRPELLYNLGNTLIKQKKYEEALQSLRQAQSKGDMGLQQSSWFNAGNALFEMGNYQESAQAYIQALRINPGDKDAKYNLELALQKMKQQKQMGKGGDKNDNSGQSQGPQDNKQSSSQSSDHKDVEKPQQSEQNKPANPQATQAEQRDESLTKERALQILDALKNQELAEQRKLLEQRARRKPNARDW